MKVTGYQLMRALKELAFAKEAAEGVFDDSLWKFDDEEKPTPGVAAVAYFNAEGAFAQVQSAQAIYNQAVKVKVEDTEMALALAVKLVGGAGRMEKKWRDITKPKKKDSWDLDESLSRRRDEGSEYAKQQISFKEAQTLAKEAAKYASALREAVQVGNSTKVEIEGLDPALFG